MGRPNRLYPAEFKADVIALARSGQMSKKQVAADFGISESTLFRWLEEARPDATGRSGAGLEDASEIAQLRRDKRRLEQEVEILRRATAYFAKGVNPK